MRRSPGPTFSFAGTQKPITSTSPRVTARASLSRSPSSVRGRCRPGVSTMTSWPRWAVHDAADGAPRGLRLVARDRDLLADQRVRERRLADVGPPDERHESGPVAVSHRWSSLLRRSRFCSAPPRTRLCASMQRLVALTRTVAMRLRAALGALGGQDEARRSSRGRRAAAGGRAPCRAGRRPSRRRRRRVRGRTARRARRPAAAR